MKLGASSHMKCPHCAHDTNIKAALEHGAYVWRIPFALSTTCESCRAPLRLLFDHGEVSLAEWMGFPPAENWERVSGTTEEISACWIDDAFQVEFEGKKYIFPREKNIA